MKTRILITIGLLLLSTTSISATTLSEIKLKLISRLAHAIIHSKTVKIYSNENSFLKHKQSKNGIEFVKECKYADLLIIDNIKTIEKSCFNKPIFITTYKEYMRFKNAIGALFWQKGRPVLIFNKKSIKKYDIDLPDEFKKYIDE